MMVPLAQPGLERSLSSSLNALPIEATGSLSRQSLQQPNKAFREPQEMTPAFLMIIINIISYGSDFVPGSKHVT